ncbi:hypothetical protein AURANDRAFT_67363 [Aureococcus anophagefferens]|uniref:Uncharacterized protein n=1 Tax=Aureococcus anophagefferens TaxID=44056 RepID=F0YKW6_AURAN|nr:hypothetical protein AURANDRAFT_67363 [Aureococcus anophagefferens]EGB04250.1 hypothetical protein AURANDRAFT_67363 [Aureococcus anophagefferens]|eukprot:XP_009041101.1 hypothetical protein AURANDRAFT_67363 [Aureococcus anophagefferens]
MALRIPTSIKFGPFAYSRVAYDTFRLAQETARSAFVYAMTSFVQDLDPLLSITCIAGEQRVLIISNTNNESARNFAKGDVSYSFQTHSIESLFLQLCFVDGKLYNSTMRNKHGMKCYVKLYLLALWRVSHELDLRIPCSWMKRHANIPDKAAIVRQAAIKEGKDNILPRGSKSRRTSLPYQGSKRTSPRRETSKGTPLGVFFGKNPAPPGARAHEPQYQGCSPEILEPTRSPGLASAGIRLRGPLPRAA